ncbi:unnamed protein product [Mycena citricolor]|uniref:Uncharacterized protein n=1 Tax=Mycena citricolor TaxID=2018698 RepID=A0AAD2HNE5_9AGAR|nr:unnamed protein product [Mycena citricolor]
MSSVPLAFGTQPRQPLIESCYKVRTAPPKKLQNSLLKSISRRIQIIPTEFDFLPSSELAHSFIELYSMRQSSWEASFEPHGSMYRLVLRKKRDARVLVPVRRARPVVRTKNNRTKTLKELRRDLLALKAPGHGNQPAVWGIRRTHLKYLEHHRITARLPNVPTRFFRYNGIENYVWNRKPSPLSRPLLIEVDDDIPLAQSPSEINSPTELTPTMTEPSPVEKCSPQLEARPRRARKKPNQRKEDVSQREYLERKCKSRRV